MFSNGNSFSDQPKAAAPWLLDVIRWPRLPGQAVHLGAGLLAVPLIAGALAFGGITHAPAHPVAGGTCILYHAGCPRGILYHA